MKQPRVNRARADACVHSIQANIESHYGLPEGSVRLVRPNGRAKRSDASIASLREEYCAC